MKYLLPIVLASSMYGQLPEQRCSETLAGMPLYTELLQRARNMPCYLQHGEGPFKVVTSSVVPGKIPVFAYAFFGMATHIGKYPLVILARKDRSIFESRTTLELKVKF